MKRVLLLHYHGLPVHHVGVKHLLGHARCLSAFGWTPTLLTRTWDGIRPSDAPWGLSWEPDLESALHGTVAIHRVAERPRPERRAPRLTDPWPLRKLLALRLLLAGPYPDPFVGWIAPAVEAASTLHRQQRFDAVLSYCPPETNVIAGSRIARRLRLPWIVYFGDLYGFHLPPDRRGARAFVQARMHRGWMRPARAAAAVSPAMARHVHETYGIPADVIVVGYDEREFAVVEAPADPNRFVISHVGSIYPAVQHPELFFDGLDAFLTARPDARDRVLVRLVGSKCEDALATMTRGRPSAGVCQILPKVTSTDAVALVRTSDVLLAFSLDDTRRFGTLSYPSKIFEAFAARRPVLVMPSDGDWVDKLLADTSGGATADTPRAVAAQLERWYDAWAHGGTISAIRPDVVTQYSHTAQAARLAALLDRAASANARSHRA
jgi:glycosyltransferase involved in cell wall biosynthesis